MALGRPGSASAIGYIEAHGTGTALGDPIDISRASPTPLAQGGPLTRRCAIGSLKTNIGHREPPRGSPA